MKKNRYTRKFLGEPGSYLTGFSAVGGDYRWCELICGSQQISFDDAAQAEAAAEWLIAWAAKAKPRSSRRKEGA